MSAAASGDCVCVWAGFGLEDLFAFFRAEVKGPSFEIHMDGRVLFIDIHSADWVRELFAPPKQTYDADSE